MGTDVYLEWTGKTEADEKKQADNILWSGGGSVGYLRATIHMQNENTILRMLFPDKYWTSHSVDEYDFIGNWNTLMQLAPVYLKAVTAGAEILASENIRRHMATIEQKTEALTSAISAAIRQTNDKAELSCPHTENLRDAVTWLRDVLDFFQLGVEKQKKGFRPYPHISW